MTLPVISQAWVNASVFVGGQLIKFADASGLAAQKPVSPVGEPAMTAQSIKITASLARQPFKSGIAEYNHGPADEGMQIEVSTGKSSQTLAKARSTHTRSSSAEESRLALRCHGICATQKVLHRISLGSPRRCKRSWRGTNPQCMLPVLTS